MAVDYSSKTTTGKTSGPVTSSKVEAAPIPQEVLVQQFQTEDIMPDPRPNEIDVFLALLTAHTMFSGGIKYWGNEKNTRGNVDLMKKRAKQIVEAY